MWDVDLKNTLGKLGLTKNEVKIYLSMLGEGQIKVNRIVELSSVGSGKIYENLNNLAEKGMASRVIKDGVQHYSASSPSKIRQLLAEREKEMDEISEEVRKAIPFMEKEYEESRTETQVEVYSGDKGLKTMLEFVKNKVDEDTEVYAVGATLERRHYVNNLWWDLVRKCESVGASYNLIFSDKKAENNVNVGAFQNLECRYFSLVNLAPVTVVDDFVLINDYKASNHVLIKSGNIADMMKNMILGFWKIAEPL